MISIYKTYEVVISINLPLKWNFSLFPISLFLNGVFQICFYTNKKKFIFSSPVKIGILQQACLTL